MFGFFAGGFSLELEDDRVLEERGNGIVRVQEVFDLETPFF